MGRVSLFRRGQTWYARYRRNGRKVRRSLDTPNRKIADARRFQLEADLHRAPTDRPRAAKPTAEFLEEYRAYSQSRKRPKSHETDMGRLVAFLSDVSPAHLGDVTTATVSNWISARMLRKSLTPATALRYREALHAFFEYAKQLGYISSNPVSGVRRPRLPERDPRFLSLDQIDELLRAVAGDLIEPLVATLVYAGLRREEACWLTWDDLDLKSNPPMLHVRAKTIGEESWLPKTKRDRKIPISPKLLAILSAHPRNGAAWVFPSPTGRRFDPDNLSHRFSELTRKAGLRWNFLELRHTFGSQLARKNLSLQRIAKLMGNSPAIAARHYINLVVDETAPEIGF